MNIFITPTIKKIKTETYLCVDNNLIKFLKKIFNKPNIEFSNLIHKKPQLIIFSGGNNLIQLSKTKEDRIRNYIDQNIFNYGIKNKIKMIGICGGAQFLAKKFGSKISKINNHVGNHKIYFNEKNKPKIFKKEQVVNSYHNFGIKKISKELKLIATAKDKSVEFFIHKKKKIIGIMWHPERYKKFNNLDKYIFREKIWN